MTVQEDVMTGPADPNSPTPAPEPAAAAADPSPPADGGTRTTHPITSLLIGLLVLASIACALVVPIYARATPHVGDFPFFYFFLLAYMPVVALALWAVTLLQRRLGNARLDSARFDNRAGGQ
jgi:hypothetical protein